MLSRFLFSIAHNYLAIECRVNETSNLYFEPYSAFRVEEGAIPPDAEISCISLDQTLDTEDPGPETDRFEWDQVEYILYRKDPDTFYLRMQHKNQTFWVWTHDRWRHSFTSATALNRSSWAFTKTAVTMAYALNIVRHNCLKVHASVIEYQGSALLFFGVSGTGKSTHSRLWQQYIPGCTLLNDDEPTLRIEEDGSIRVYGAPWSGSTPCYKNHSAQVAGIVHLYQHPENKLTRLKGYDAFSSLLTSSSIMRTDEENKNFSMDLVIKMINKVPLYRLDCRPDEEAVSLTFSIMKEHLEKNNQSL